MIDERLQKGYERKKEVAEDEKTMAKTGGLSEEEDGKWREKANNREQWD